MGRRRKRFPITATDEQLIQQADSDPVDLFSKQEHDRYILNRALEIIRVDMKDNTFQAALEALREESDLISIASKHQLTFAATYQAKHRLKNRLREILAEMIDFEE